MTMRKLTIIGVITILVPACAVGPVSATGPDSALIKSISGDVNADGASDRINLMNDEGGNAVITATVSGQGKVKVSTVRMVEDMTISLANLSDFDRACQKGAKALCSIDGSVRGSGADAIILTYPEVSKSLYYFENRQFERVFLSD